MSTVVMKEIETERELREVLDLRYDILGTDRAELYGYEACRENYRRQGITKALMAYFEELARKKGFRYITLGSKEDAFYEKCGYQVIFQVHEQNIYQKVL